MPSPIVRRKPILTSATSFLSALWTRRPALGAISTVVIACLWLNQGPTLLEYERAQNEPPPVAWPAALVHRARQPFAFLYRKSADEELYFNTALAIRGLPFDRSVILRTHDGAPTEFADLPAADGRFHMPYAEVPLEYPALVLLFIMFPAFASSDFDGFARLFGVVMAACLLVACALCIHADPCSRADWKRQRWWLASALLLAQGGLAIQRLDAIVAVLLALSVWAAGRNKPGMAGAALGLSIGAKFLPALLLAPLWAADRRRLEDRRTIGRALGGVLLGVFISLGPMLALSPHAISSVLRYHASRGLHVESTFGLGLALWRLIGGRDSPTSLSFGSYNFVGGSADVLAALTTPLLMVAIGLLTLRTARSESLTRAPRTDAIAVAILGGCVAIWLSAKVFSPQYLTWALPISLALSARPGRKIICLLVATMAITQLYHRGYYDSLAEGRLAGVLTLLARQSVIAWLGMVLLRFIGGSRRSPGGTTVHEG
jgi:uncharacterized protein YqgC (DUF456 family)